MKALYNFAVTVKDDEESIDFMYRLLGGLIYAVSNSKMLSLNFYPILAELGTVADRLAKICGWSPKLYRIMKDGARPVDQRYTKPEETAIWLRTIRDKTMGGRVRLFVGQFVQIPNNIYDANELQAER